MSQQEFSNELLGAFLQTELTQPIAVKAEDIQQGSGLNFSEIFFEPQTGKSYRVRFVQNPFGENLTHRKVYKKLPDPERRGKTFHYISSGNAQTCKVLNLFFKLNEEKKSGNALAESKINEYLSSTNQGCSLVQIVTSDDENIKAGEFRLWVFSTYGPNASVANLINQKINPTPEMIEDGDVPENIWNIFSAPTLLVSPTEAEYNGVKGRDFTKCSWSKKNIGVEIKMEDGTTYQFSKDDIVNGTLRLEAQKAFSNLLEKLKDDKLSVHNYFAYSELGDPKNSEATENHLKQVLAKVDKIVPIIENAKSIAEIQNYCKVIESGEENQNNSKSILEESIPDEIKGSDVLMQSEPVQNTTSTTGTSVSGLDEAAAILQGN